MDRRDFYFRQKVTEGEMDEAFNDVETAIWALIGDLGFVGIASGLAVTQQGSPNMTVQVSAGVAYQQNGKRINVAAVQNVNCALDENGVSTTVAGVGNSRKLSIFLEWDRAPSDPRTDGNSNTVYYDRLETFHLNVAASAEGVSPTLPALRADQLLLADITLTYGQTTITNAAISTARRSSTFSVSGSPQSIAAANILAGFSQLLTIYNNHVAGTDKHAAADVNYAGGGAWADGTTNPGVSVEAQLDKIVTDLASTTASNSGSHKLGIDALGNWADGTTNASTTLRARVAAIVSVLAATTASNSGAAKIGIDALSNWLDGGTNPATTLRAAVNKIITDLISQTASSSGARKVGVEALGNWYDGATNPATSVYGALAKVVSDLILTTGGASGAHKVGAAARTSWLDGTTNVAASVFAAIDKIITDLNLQTVSGSGARKVGIEARTSWLDATANAAGSVFSAIDKIITDLNASTGSAKIGGASYTATGGVTIAAGSVQAQIRALADLTYKQYLRNAQQAVNLLKVTGPSAVTAATFRGVQQTPSRDTNVGLVIWDSKGATVPSLHYATAWSATSATNLEPATGGVYTAVTSGTLGSGEVIRAVGVQGAYPGPYMLLATSAGLKYSDTGGAVATVTSFPAGAYVDAIYTPNGSWIAMKDDGTIVRLTASLSANGSYTTVRAAIGAATLSTQTWGRRFAFAVGTQIIMAAHATNLAISTNDGSTWSNLTNPDPTSKEIVGLACNIQTTTHRQTRTWFLVTRRTALSSVSPNTIVWRSTDDGVNWTAVFTSASSSAQEYYDQVELVNETLYVSGYTAATGVEQNILVSPNNGDNFYRIGFGGQTSSNLGIAGDRIAYLSFDDAQRFLVGPKILPEIYY